MDTYTPPYFLFFLQNAIKGEIKKMGNIVKKNELIDLLSEKTGFYKKNIKDIVEALADVILENMQSATFEQPSELHLRHGVIIGGRRVPERNVKDPRTGETVLSPEKVIPYATFKSSVRQKLYER